MLSWACFVGLKVAIVEAPATAVIIDDIKHHRIILGCEVIKHEIVADIDNAHALMHTMPVSLANVVMRVPHLI